MNTREAAKKLGVHQGTVLGMIRSGLLEAEIREDLPGHPWEILDSDVELVLELDFAGPRVRDGKHERALQMLKRGVTTDTLADHLGVKIPSARRFANRHGYSFQDGSDASAYMPAVPIAACRRRKP